METLISQLKQKFDLLDNSARTLVIFVLAVLLGSLFFVSGTTVGEAIFNVLNG
jgi:hypothetical protein